MPTTVVGLFDNSIAFPDTGKLFLDASKQALASYRALMLPGTPFIPEPPLPR